MGEININSAVDLISSEQLKQRSEGLADLKHILQKNWQSSKPIALNDKSCHKVFEALFKFAAAEKSLYRRGNRPTAKTQSANRLSECASVFRLATVVLVRNIRFKTVKAVVDHITQILPTPGEGLWEHLSNDYLKALKTLLQYPAHVEHLVYEWGQIVKFCLKGIGNSENEEGSQLTIRSFQRLRSESVDVNEGRSTPVRAQPNKRPQANTTRGTGNVTELLTCLQLLTSCPNAPVLTEAESLLNNLTDFLDSCTSSTSTSSSHHLALSAFNSVLARTITDNTELTQGAILNIIPIIRQLWPTKSATLKDEMLVTLTLGRGILPKLGNHPASESLVESLGGLVEQIRHDYLRRLEKERLQIDDLVFAPGGEVLPMGIPGIAPRLGDSKTEQNWTTTWTIATLSMLLDRLSASSNTPPSDDAAPSKKQRLLSRSEDTLREASFASGASKICALQVTPFLLAEGEFAPDSLASSLGHLTSHILDDSDNIASWTMVAISSIAGHDSAKSNNLKTQWAQVWELASRTSAAPGTSRAACNLMSVILKHELLGHTEIADTVKPMISSVELNGPSTLTDSALFFWSLLIKLRTKTNPSLGPGTVKQICGWLKETWNLGPLADRLYATQIATFARPLDLLGLLLTCTGRSFPQVPSSSGVIPGTIGRAWLCHNGDQDLVQYLYLTDDPKFSEVSVDSVSSDFYIEPSTRNDPNDQVVLELLQTKIENFGQAWTALSTERPQLVSTDFIRVLVSLCLTTSLFVEFLPSPPSYRCQELQNSNLHLWQKICNFFSQSREDYVYKSLEIFAPLLSLAQPSQTSQNIVYNGLRQLAPQIIEVLEEKRDMALNISGAEPMDIDDTILSDNHPETGDSILNLDRRELPIFGGEKTSQRFTAIQLLVFYRYLGPTEELSNTALIDYLSSFDEADILSVRRLLPSVFHSVSGMSRDDVYGLLEYYAEKCLQSYELERCEASLCICINLMSTFVDLWTIDEDDDLSQVAFDMYDWFTQVPLKKGLASPRVLINFAELLFGVIRNNPDYSGDDSGPSARTSLFRILQDGELTVKFHVSGVLPGLFNRFVLKEHDAIFEDVLVSLPCDPDWIEGIAVRVYALARLASEWHTLLRQTIYYIVETPYEVPPSNSHTTRCLQNVSRALSLRDPQEIFRLFSPQLLYTWMEERPINTIPFSIFGYLTLPEMLRDIQDELVGQIIMRGNNSEATELSNQLETPFKDLLSSSFYKAGAYSLARDISLPPSQDTEMKSVQGWMKKLLGVDKYRALMEKNFPQIVATLFTSIDQEEQIERAITKRTDSGYALEALQDILGKSSSISELRAKQQPSFRARFLLDELETLCQKTGYDFETLWTPAMVTFVARSLFDSINPSLGPLHACSVLRRLRVLVCLAHPTVLQDYPLEMLLRELLPFLTNFRCSEDALGLFWYLMEKGRPYLLGTPSFLAGIAVSTLASLRGLLTSSQDSTTQESEFKTALNKAQQFHDWFGTFLDRYDFMDADVGLERSFRSIIRSSQNIRQAGNASKGTYESELLLELLDDRASGRNLLSNSASDLVLSFLVKDFQSPSNFRDDIFGEDRVAAANAVVVWETLEDRSHDKGYLLWAAKALGRAYAATGLISDVLLREQDPRLFKDLVQTDDSPIASKVAILLVLSEMLLSNHRPDIGLAERTLQLIVSRQADYAALEECEQAISPFLMKSLQWMPYQCPELPLESSRATTFKHEVRWNPDPSVADWARSIALSLALSAAKHPIIGVLPKILDTIPSLSIRLLPYILHETLLFETDGNRKVRQDVSNMFHQAFVDLEDKYLPHMRLIINCLLYLRSQPLPSESTVAERDTWLEINFMEAANAATRCRMYKTSLLFAETHASRIASTSRRSSMARTTEQPLDLLHDIFRNIDDPDLLYGVREDPSLESVMGKLQHESHGLKNLSFQSASYDIAIKRAQSAEVSNPYAMIKALNSTNLQGVASAMFSAPGSTGNDPGAVESLLLTSMDLQQWDIPAPTAHSSAVSSLFKAFQGLNLSKDETKITNILDDCFLGILDQLFQENRSVHFLRSSMKGLSVLTEIDETLSSRSSEQLQEQWTKIVSRDSWFKNERFQDINQIISSHEALFSSIKHKEHLKTMLKQSSRDAQLSEVKVVRESLRVSREHEALQASLKSAILLSSLVEPCAEMGVNISAAAKYDLANVLWDQGEMTTSIQMLQQLREQNDLHKQAIPVSRAEVLANLGHHIAEARLQKPEAIIQDYLTPAIKELKGSSDGEEAGRVFHEFATFCDQQLQNADGLEDFTRIEQLRDRKEKEVTDLETMMKSAEGKERDQLKVHRIKTKQWFDLDDREYQRLKRSRESFLQQCLENYLLCLKSCDTYKNDALRFCALWLDKSGVEIANEAVSKHIDQVPSRKFVPLMNQLSSRLLDTTDTFQSLLNAVVYRICVDHPYHGMYQIFASSKSKGGKDQTAMARHQAANKLVDRLKADKRAGNTWVDVHNSNITFVRFAAEKLDEKVKQGAKVNLVKSVWGKRLEQDVTIQKIPPPTMTIDLRADCDYSSVPRLVKFQSEFTVASGISAPKIVTARASDGLRYKQLFKGGNDDLRQDSIMEQVFEQVSNLLKDHRATRQRNLGIRTYKVLPLTANAGIIEFVQNTIPLHEYLIPAHTKHYPKDMKPNACRKYINDVQTKSLEQRYKVYRQVTDRFHPVMRYFFMERFKSPDDWFSKRLAYTRSTAAISILGHVLGLGDRHGHNILLDEKTGEVVHIDLGVAFEQGRVLPIPEVVPFRLTRDLVDGMGITGTEGVFRRCCEFTLEALRQDSYSIMTVLDVLRYDPLYSWSISPLRIKRMQDTQEGGGAHAPVKDSGKGNNPNEPSEADRALTVVEKKLGKTLSVTATVNELIQQATDERNLAVLYCGWAAYA